MSLVIPNFVNLLFVYDTHYSNDSLSIYFNSEGSIVELVHNGQATKDTEILEYAYAILLDRVFPHIQVLEDVEASPQLIQPEPLNPTEEPRKEVAAESICIDAICDRCPVACKVRIAYTAAGKFVSVTGNACDRGVEFAQDLVLKKFS